MEAKRQLSSKTNWFALALVIASQITDLLKNEEVIVFLGSNIGWIGSTIGVVVFILRQYTKIGVSWGGINNNSIKVTHEENQADDSFFKNDEDQ